MNTSPFSLNMFKSLREVYPTQEAGIPIQYTHVQRDSSEIRQLAIGDKGVMSHCSLEAGRVSTARRHTVIEKIWHVLEGQGEFWIKEKDQERVVKVQKGSTVTIPKEAHFQFRVIGDATLKALCTAMPPWSENENTIEVKGHWNIAN